VRRIAILGLVVAATCAGCGGSSSATPTQPAAFRGHLLEPPVAAPSFSLRDQNGRQAGPRRVRGSWVVVAFLYTHCPDVCPLIADNLAAAQRRLGDLRVLAVSVDPKGDTPKAVRTFIRHHHLPQRFQYLTGTLAQLAPVWARYHVAALNGPGAIVSHSAFEILVDPKGRERLLYDAHLEAADLAHDLTRLKP
jgi:protein SCO1